MKKQLLGYNNVVGQAEPDLEAAQKAIGDFLTALAIDWQNDVNMCDTPARVAKMYIDELFAGRYKSAPELRDFATARTYNSLHVSGPWEIKSICAHHLAPVLGKCVIGVLPKKGSHLLGLSKFGRIVQWYARRPTLQEELVEQIADHLNNVIKPQALGIYINCSHLCCTFRGLNSTDSRFVTTALRGDMLKASIKQEFIAECHQLLK